MFYFSSFLQVFRVTKEMRVALSRCLAALTLLAHVHPPLFPRILVFLTTCSPQTVLCTQFTGKYPAVSQLSAALPVLDAPYSGI